MTDYPRKDRWHRPLIVPPDGGQAKGYTRCTTLAKVLNGMEGLSRWQQRMAVGGATLRPDVLAQVSANWPPTDTNKAQLDQYVDTLREAAAASSGANLGDALHLMTARLDRGEAFSPMPPYDTDIKAYQELLEAAGIEIIPELVERTVVLDSIQIAGSFDRVVAKMVNGLRRLFIADLKTGTLDDYIWPQIAIQLAIYSRAEALYRWEDDSREPVPEIDQKHGLVIHLPPGKGAAALHVVDLEAGWQAAQMCLWVKEWRARKDLARPARLNGKGA